MATGRRRGRCGCGRGRRAFRVCRWASGLEGWPEDASLRLLNHRGGIARTTLRGWRWSRLVRRHEARIPGVSGWVSERRYPTGQRWAFPSPLSLPAAIRISGLRADRQPPLDPGNPGSPAFRVDRPPAAAKAPNSLRGLLLRRAHFRSGPRGAELPTPAKRKETRQAETRTDIARLAKWVAERDAQRVDRGAIPEVGSGRSTWSALPVSISDSGSGCSRLPQVAWIVGRTVAGLAMRAGRHARRGVRPGGCGRRPTGAGKAWCCVCTALTKVWTGLEAEYGRDARCRKSSGLNADPG